MRPLRPLSSRRGLTLLEVLVATLISIVVIGLILQMFSSVSTLWRRSEERIDTEREARAALDRIRRDLERVVRAPASPSGEPPPEVLHLLPASGETSDDPPASNAFEQLQALVFLPNPGGSDLCTVAYRCVWDDETRCYTLVRSVNDSDATLASLVGEPSQDHAADPPGEPITSHEEPLARYVWNLTFRPVIDGIAAASPFPDRLPAAVEIRFNALGSLAVEKLHGFPITEITWQTPDDPLYTRLIAPYARSYFIRVPLHAGERGGSSTSQP